MAVRRYAAYCFWHLMLVWTPAVWVHSFIVPPIMPTSICSSSADCHRTRLWTANNREQLLDYIEQLNNNESRSRRLPCGLDCTASERETVAGMIAKLVEDPRNLVQSQNGNIQTGQVLGTWQLLYTSSRTMQINKSLSGLGRSSSELAEFAGLTMKLSGSKMLGFVEYVEIIGSGPDNAIEVTINGEFLLEDEKDFFTGQPTKSIRSELENISYGPTTNNAQDWSSLGPVKLLDLLYLDDDDDNNSNNDDENISLQISRGSVNTDSLFVWKRIDP